MSAAQPNNPLHGLSLEKIVTQLVEHYGWADLYSQIRINCFHKLEFRVKVTQLQCKKHRI